ncbi:hypothetical protein NXY28_17975 [Bacteroides thetaiotaomicron]|nr:hypothetical protein NXY28_17975 [Bacteroides thetaiotaomicron]
MNEVLEGKYNILKDTGFRIHSDTKRFEIHIGKVKVTDNFTVADILSEWSKYKVYCFLKYDADDDGGHTVHCRRASLFVQQGSAGIPGG